MEGKLFRISLPSARASINILSGTNFTTDPLFNTLSLHNPTENMMLANVRSINTTLQSVLPPPSEDYQINLCLRRLNENRPDEHPMYDVEYRSTRPIGNYFVIEFDSNVQGMTNVRTGWSGGLNGNRCEVTPTYYPGNSNYNPYPADIQGTLFRITIPDGGSIKQNYFNNDFQPVVVALVNEYVVTPGALAVTGAEGYPVGDDGPECIFAGYRYNHAEGANETAVTTYPDLPNKDDVEKFFIRADVEDDTNGGLRATVREWRTRALRDDELQVRRTALGSNQ